MEKAYKSPWGEVVENDRVVTVGDVEMDFTCDDGVCEYRVSSAKNLIGLRRVRLSRKYDHLIIRPSTPDLPVVLKPEIPICLVPGAKVTYDVRVPVWVQLVAKRGSSISTANEEILEELPSRKLRPYWFGSVDEGEGAYGLKFAPAVQPRYQRHHIIVPLSVSNSSQTALWFQRLIVRVVHLEIFGDGNRLFTNDVRVVFKGPEQLSQITFSTSSSLAGDSTSRLANRRVPTSNDIIRKSFMLLRDLTG